MQLVDYDLSEEYWEVNSLIEKNFVKTNEKNEGVARGEKINISLPTHPTLMVIVSQDVNARHFYLSFSIDIKVISFALEIFLRKCLIISV